jgi:hypothetical protein
MAAACACRQPQEAPRSPSPPIRASAAEQPWSSAPSFASNAGTYLLRVQPDPARIPQGRRFALQVWVFRADSPDQPCSAVELTVDADMPEHGHGLPRIPSVQRVGPGSFDVSGLRLHMPGYWELYFDVTQGAATERAQLGFTLE